MSNPWLNTNRHGVRYADPDIPPSGFKVGDVVMIIDKRDGAVLYTDTIAALSAGPAVIASFKSAGFTCSIRCLKLVSRKS